MAADELAQIKTALAELNEREARAHRRALTPDHRPASPQSEPAELQALLSADPDLGKFGEILTRYRDRRGKALRAQQAQVRSEAQGSQAADAAALAEGVAARRHALGLLAQPFTSSYVTLEEPFLIWELPHPDLSIFRDSGIEPLGSWVKVLLETSSGPGYTDFRFYFLWENPSDYYAVANVSSSLVLYGAADAFGSWGFLSGNTANLEVAAYLSVVRWSGWGDDPSTGQSNDQTQYPIYDYQSANKSIVSFNAYGGDFFNDGKPESTPFPPEMYDVNARLIAIPGGAVTLFEVGLTVGWSFAHGGENVEEEDQSITLDLAYDKLGYIARCPMVELEILTPPAVNIAEG